VPGIVAELLSGAPATGKKVQQYKP